jgi:branched-chain amino acid transport system ATP-binding protein
MILEVKGIHTYYGASHVLHGVSFAVARGEAVCLLGRNGVGKTTTLRSILGLTPPSSGSILFKGRELRGRPTYEIVRMGIGYAPADRQIFPDLTTRENLEIAARPLKDGQERWTLGKVYTLFPALKSREGSKGMYLSGGEQKMLAIGRALMGNPELLILDEPSEGLSPVMVSSLIEVILRIKEQGVTLLIADQNLKFARRVADRGYIMEKGAIQHEGTMKDLWENEAIVRKYLAV